MALIKPLSKMKSLLLAALSVLSFGGPAVADSFDVMSLDGREFLLYRANSTEGKPAPLVIVLHGAFQSGEKMHETLPLEQLAEKHGFNVAYPTGTPLRPGGFQRQNGGGGALFQRFGGGEGGARFGNREGGERPFAGRMQRKGGANVWNAGDCCGAAAEQNVDDVGFLSDIIDGLVRNGTALADQITIVGHSNGAMMGYRFVCERPGKVQRLVAISGMPVVKSCGNLRGLSILHIHGTEDNTVPVSGGASERGIFGTIHPSIDDTVNMMRRAGADITVRLVQRGGHRIDELNSLARRQFGAAVDESVVQAVENRI